MGEAKPKTQHVLGGTLNVLGLPPAPGSVDPTYFTPTTMLSGPTQVLHAGLAEPGLAHPG